MMKMVVRIFSAVIIFSMMYGCSKPVPVNPGDDTGDGTEESKSYDSEIDFMHPGEIEPEEALLVTDVCMPSGFVGVLHSDVLEIHGHGFETEDRLYFLSPSGNQMEASPVSVTESTMRFKLPSSLLSGEWSLRLSRKEQYQSLGMRTIVCDTPSGTDGINVHGTVSSEGKALARITVSDGYAMTITDDDGSYRLISEKTNGYVFITVPSGMRCPTQNQIPAFFAYTTSPDNDDCLDFTLVPENNERHRVIFLADLHISNYTNNDLEFYNRLIVPEINDAVSGTSVPSYIMVAGDSTTDHRWVSCNFALPEWKNLVSVMPAPVFHSMGNHDNIYKPKYDLVAESVFKQVIGPSWYSVNIGRVHYVILDNIIAGSEENENHDDYIVSVAAHQLEWLRRDLLFVDKATPVVVLMHSPLYHYISTTALTPHFYSMEGVRELLQCFEGLECVHFVSGHKHTNHNIVLSSSIMEHNMAASSGSVWFTMFQTGKHYCRDGSRGGLQIWDVNSKDIRWVHKAPGFSVEKSQFHVIDLNNVPSESRGDVPQNSLLINIYNWDEEWKLSVKEDGKELPWKQVYRKDPIFDLVCPDQTGSSTKTPTATEHIFTVTASSPDSTVEVLVTDRFGKVYGETVSRPKAFDLSTIQ